MDYTGILSSATSLRKNSLYKVTIAEATREILLQLNSDIMRAHDAGLSTIDFRLPIHFRQIDNSVTNAEIQTSVYYNIVTELERKDYSVRLQFHKQYTVITVSWTTRVAINELDQMRAKIIALSRE